MVEKDSKSDSEYVILRIVNNNPKATQRDIAEELNVSLGKTNYLIRALIDKGLLKYDNLP